MRLEEFKDALCGCRSLTECDRFLRESLSEARFLFYGPTRAELQKQSFDYEQVLFAFENSPAGREIVSGAKPPSSVLALLVFLLSVFHRAGLRTAILRVADLLPPGPLRYRAEAVFQYKHITDSRRDYIERFNRIVELIQKARESAPENRRAAGENLLLEYALDALLVPLDAGVDLRAQLRARFLDDGDVRRRCPVLSRVETKIRRLLGLDVEELRIEQNAVRCRIAEDLYSEACELLRERPLAVPSEEPELEREPGTQQYEWLPDWLEGRLMDMGAEYRQRRSEARRNLQLSHGELKEYLGTYFPRTVVEAWNVVAELLWVQAVCRMIFGKNPIRILDLGSGTGGAVVGTLLALDRRNEPRVIEVTSIDGNQEALGLQVQILQSLQGGLPFEVVTRQRVARLPTDVDGFVAELSAMVQQMGSRYDLVLCWKFLSEFYNSSYASALGIIKNTLRIASRALAPDGLCIAADVTTCDNGHEFFPEILNREANQHDSDPEASMRTVLPLPCAWSSSACGALACFTQRRFAVRHRLAPNDQTKIAYRVFAPSSFARSVVATFTRHPAYRVNARRADEACFGGGQREAATRYPCGYTGFFAKRS